LDLHSFGLTSFPGEGFLFGLKLPKKNSLLGLVSFLIQIINKLGIIYFLFTRRLTNERVGVFLARCSVQHNILFCFRRHDSFYGNT
jgi:hypothetical protein